MIEIYDQSRFSKQPLLKVKKQKKVSVARVTGLLALLLIVQSYSTWGQGIPPFAQYMNNLTPINNAYSTMEDAARISVTGRKRFIGIDSSPSSFLFNGSIPVAGLGGAAGLVVMKDKIGVEDLTSMNCFFAKKIQLAQKSFLSLSVSAGFSKYVVNYSALDANDSQFNNNDIDQSSPMIGLGLMFYTDKAYIGLSVPQALLKNTPNSNNSYYLTAGYLAQLGTNFSIRPAALVCYAGPVNPLMLDISTTLYIKELIGIGIGYRNNQVASGILSLALGRNIQMGYSYGVNVGSMPSGIANSSSQEITVGIRFGKKTTPVKLL